MFGTCSLVFASLTFILLPEENDSGIGFGDTPDEKQPTKLKMRNLLKDHRVVFDLIAVIVCCLIIGFNTSTLALWIEQFNPSISMSSLIFLTYGIVYGTSSFINGFISNQFVSIPEIF